MIVLVKFKKIVSVSEIKLLLMTQDSASGRTVRVCRMINDGSNGLCLIDNPKEMITKWITAQLELWHWPWCYEFLYRDGKFDFGTKN